MNRRTYIEAELKEIGSSLPAAVPPPPYAVPEGYFEGLAERMLALVRPAASAREELAELSPLLSGLSRSMPFTLPEGYFGHKAEEALDLARTEELPALLQGARTLPYEVPAGYFEQFPDRMRAQVAPSRARVVPMGRRFLRVAAAAMVAGLIALSGYFYFNGGSSEAVTVDSPQWVAKNLKGVSNEDLKEFIEIADVPMSGNGSRTSAPEVKSMLSDVSNSELEAFLSDLPTADESLSVIN